MTISLKLCPPTSFHISFNIMKIFNFLIFLGSLSLIISSKAVALPQRVYPTGNQDNCVANSLRYYQAKSDLVVVSSLRDRNCDYESRQSLGTQFVGRFSLNIWPQEDGSIHIRPPAGRGESYEVIEIGSDIFHIRHKYNAYNIIGIKNNDFVYDNGDGTYYYAPSEYEMDECAKIHGSKCWGVKWSPADFERFWGNIRSIDVLK
ncbi:MAG: hypothetical protein AB4058_00310 [Microcystaceae cyanobacterium]